MNDYTPIEPDPPAILLRNSNHGVVMRWRPASVEEAARILARDVFDVENSERRAAELRAAEEEQRAQEERRVFLAQKRAELDSQIRKAICSAAGECDNEIGDLAQKLLANLSLRTFEVHSRPNTPCVGLFDAMDAPAYAAQAVSKEVERRVYLALMAKAVFVVV
jgi:hypothetical protein